MQSAREILTGLKEQPEYAAFWAILDEVLDGSRATNTIVIDQHAVAEPFRKECSPDGLFHITIRPNSVMNHRRT